MNTILTILIAGLLGTGQVPDAPDEIRGAAVNVQPPSLLYSFTFNNDIEGNIDSNIWEQILTGMVGSGNAEFFEVYLISGNDLTKATKLCRIPNNDHSYSLNVPPASKLIYVGKHVNDGNVSYSINGIVNKQNSWVYISAVLKNQKLKLFSKNDSQMLTSLQPK